MNYRYFTHKLSRIKCYIVITEKYKTNDMVLLGLVGNIGSSDRNFGEMAFHVHRLNRRNIRRLKISRYTMYLFESNTGDRLSSLLSS